MSVKSTASRLGRLAAPFAEGAAQAGAAARCGAEALQHGNLLVPLVAAAQVASTFLLLGAPVDGALTVLAACGALLVYHVDRAWLGVPEDAVNQPGRVCWVRAHPAYVAASTAGAVVLGAAMLPLVPGRVVVAGLVLGAAGLAYLLPWGRTGRRLKRIWWLKPAAVAGAWALGGTALPALAAGSVDAGAVAALVAYRLGTLLPNVLLADWPDRRGDARSGLSTPALRWSPDRLRYTAMALLAGAVAGAALAVMAGAPRLLLLDAVGALVLLAWLAQGWPRSRWFYGLAIDAAVAWPLTLLLAA